MHDKVQPISAKTVHPGSSDPQIHLRNRASQFNSHAIHRFCLNRYPTQIRPSSSQWLVSRPLGLCQSRFLHPTHYPFYRLLHSASERLQKIRRVQDIFLSLRHPPGQVLPLHHDRKVSYRSGSSPYRLLVWTDRTCTLFPRTTDYNCSQKTLQ
jgi:hypothetical protein